METVMNGIEKHAEYYHGYLPDDRSVIPLTIALATIVFGFSSTWSAPSARNRGPRPPNPQRMCPSSSRVL
jgi:hypothetical protein